MLDQSQHLLQVVADIRNRIETFLSEQDLWHGARHVARVVEFARQINRVEMADPFLVEAGAWLHQLHDPYLDLLKSILEKLRVTPEQRDRLFEIVEQCRPNRISANSSLEARVVFDADAGDLMGPAGILREALCNYGDRAQPLFDAISGARTVQILFVEKLQTAGGKNLYKDRIAAANAFWESLSRDEQTLSEASRIASIDFRKSQVAAPP